MPGAMWRRRKPAWLRWPIASALLLPFLVLAMLAWGSAIAADYLTAVAEWLADLIEALTGG